MPKSAYQKLKLLYIVRLLEEQTDEAHPITVNTLIQQLAQHGIAAERKSIYSDMEVLEQYGYDIVRRRGPAGANAYYLGQRQFQLPEVKLLVDAVQSAKFITADKSRVLIKKICTLTSRHEASLMQRQVQVQDRGKTVNKRTYYNVDALHSAIAGDRQVSFYYHEWAIDPKAPKLVEYRRRRGGRLYKANPWALLWDDEYYYLIATDPASGAQRHYRVDRMDHITLSNNPRQGAAGPTTKELASYSKSVFGMFGGEKTEVRLRFSNHLIGVVIDRFGPDIIVLPDGDSHFIINTAVAVSPQFFSWLLGFGTSAKLLGPQNVAQQLKLLTTQLAAQYAKE